MITVRTPLRVSFAGGGSDLPAFYKKHGGAVLSAGLDRYVYLSAHPYFYNNKILCKYSENELVSSASEIRHNIFRIVLQKFDLNGIELISMADVPAGTGLGSSSSFTVALLHLLYTYTNKYVSAEHLAEEACNIEINILGEPIGKQDQYAAAFGGLNIYRFFNNGKVGIEPVIMSDESYSRMENNLLMFYTGDVRSASIILSEQSKNIISDDEKEKAQIEICSMVDDLNRELSNERIDSLGNILQASWEQKKKLASGITNKAVDGAYEKAMSAGAMGGKLLGAGGGGFLLFYVPEHRHNAVKNALTGLKYLPFRFAKSGSQIIYVGERSHL